MEDAENGGADHLAALHGQLIRARTADRNALIDRDLIAGQDDILPAELGSELNCVPIYRGGDHIAQRACPAVFRARCGESGSLKAIIYLYQSEPNTAVLPGQYCR